MSVTYLTEITKSTIDENFPDINIVTEPVRWAVVKQYKRENKLISEEGVVTSDQLTKQHTAIFDTQDSADAFWAHPLIQELVDMYNIRVTKQ